MPEYLRVKNFDQFQHYRDRTPPWIKLYNAVLDDYDFACLPDESKWHLIAIWLLASRTENRIPNDAAWIAKRINAENTVDLNVFISGGFLLVEQCASTVLAEGSETALDLPRSRETETETETEGEGEEKEASPPAPSAKKLNSQQERVKAVLDLWEGSTDVPPEPKVAARWLKEWEDNDEAMLEALAEIKAMGAFPQGWKYVASILENARKRGGEVPPPFRDARRGGRPAPPGSDEIRKQQAREIDRELGLGEAYS